MNESEFRSKVVKMLRSLDAVAVENPVHPGTPDVDCSLGWLELKVDKWDSKMRVPLDHFTPQQKVWLRRRTACRGLAVLLVRMETGEWFMFTGDRAYMVPGKPITWVSAHADYYWAKTPRIDDLLFALGYLHQKLRD